MQFAAKVVAEVIPTHVLQTELQAENGAYSKLQQHVRRATAASRVADGTSAAADQLQSLNAKVHEAFR